MLFQPQWRASVYQRRREAATPLRTGLSRHSAFWERCSYWRATACLHRPVFTDHPMTALSITSNSHFQDEDTRATG